MAEDRRRTGGRFSIAMANMPILGRIVARNRREETGRPSRNIYRQALGRIAWLGDLYDATTDNFCQVSVFRLPLSPDSPAVSRTDNPYSKTKFANVSSLEEKFRGLKVSAELQLSIVVGMCELAEGYAEYLRQRRDGFGTVTSTQLCHIKTVTERLEVSHDQVKSNISEDAMRHPGATHVVIKIEWGANCVITAREQRHVIENRRRTGGRFGIAMGNMPIFGRIVARKRREETEEEAETSVYIFGDVLPDELPQTLVDAQKTMKIIPKLVKNYNNGKGKPLTYIMIPICALNGLVPERLSESTKTFISIDDATTKRIVRLFDDMTELRHKVGDRLEDYEARAKRELYQLVESVRSGKENVRCLDDFCNNYYTTRELLIPTPDVQTTGVPDELDRLDIHRDELRKESSSDIYASTDEIRL